MILDDQIREQLAEYLKLLENDIRIEMCTGSDEASEEMQALIEELASMSPKIHV